MEVYIEYVILDNFVIDCLLLLLTNLSLKQRILKIRLIISALFGTVFTVVLPLFRLLSFFEIVLKILMCCLMVMISAKWKPKKYLLALIIFLIFTFLFGGSIVGILFLFGANFSTVIEYYESFNFPISLVLIVPLATFVVGYILIKKIYQNRMIKNFTLKTILRIFDRDYEFNGYLDSGNFLVDSQTNLPVVILKKGRLKSVFSSCDIDKLKDFKTRNLEIATIGGNKSLEIFKPENFKVYIDGEKNINIDVMVGISDFDDKTDIDILLNASMIL